MGLSQILNVYPARRQDLRVVSDTCTLAPRGSEYERSSARTEGAVLEKPEMDTQRTRSARSDRVLQLCESLCLLVARKGVGPVEKRNHIGFTIDLKRCSLHPELPLQIDKADLLSPLTEGLFLVGPEN